MLVRQCGAMPVKEVRKPTSHVAYRRSMHIRCEMQRGELATTWRSKSTRRTTAFGARRRRRHDEPSAMPPVVARLVVRMTSAPRRASPGQRPRAKERGPSYDAAMRILLVSANREKLPQPVVPIGPLAVAAALRDAHEVRLLDLCFEDEPRTALDRVIADLHPEVIGIGLRNLHTNAYD